MTAETRIEWCDSTFNPWIGCTKISPACDHCYAAAQMDTRMGRVQWGAGNPRSRTSAAYWKHPVYWNRRPFVECIQCGWRGEQPPVLNNNGLQIGFSNMCPSCRDNRRGSGELKPARRRVFCASLADVFDNEVDPGWRADLFDLIANTTNLDWLLLTKRIGNAADMISAALLDDGPQWPWRNVWLGATICNQSEAERDIPKLLATPAVKRFLSIEPMLGPIDLRVAFTGHCPTHDFHGGFCLQRNHAGVQHLDWIICGGESGPHARPMHPDWARSLRDQCSAAGVPFLFKQWGEWCPRGPAELGYPPVDRVPRLRMTDTGENGSDLGAGGDNHVWMNRAGKHAAGRLLDGVEHNGVPA